MKKITTTFVFLVLCSGLWAQYKKASFFSKSGRTYGIGTQLYAMGDGKGSPIGFHFSFGRDQDGKRLFTFQDIRFIPSFKFSYETSDYWDVPVTVTGTSKPMFIYSFNYGYYILKNESGQKVKPYITAGINMMVFGGVKSLDNDDYYNVKKQAAGRNLSIGIGGGLGTIVNLSGRFSLKLEGGYTYQYNADENTDTEYKDYFMYTSHPYASAGIRLRMVED